jgi:hypothetical protein
MDHRAAWPFVLLVAAGAAATGCQRMRQPPAHVTVRARNVEVFLDGLRPTLVGDLRVEIIGGLAGATYELGPAFAAATGSGDAGQDGWMCLGGECSAPVDAASELYPAEIHYLLDQLAEAQDVAWPPRVRFEIREHTAAGVERVVEASEEKVLDEACARLGRVPLQLRQSAREKTGAEGELTIDEAQTGARCEGPLLHLELEHRVMPLPGTVPIVRLAVGIPGFPETACRGRHCEVLLQPPDRGSAVIDKPLGACFAALGRPAARAQVHVFLERRPETALASGEEGERIVLDHYVFELVSPGAGVVP